MGGKHEIPIVPLQQKNPTHFISIWSNPDPSSKKINTSVLQNSQNERGHLKYLQLVFVYGFFPPSVKKQTIQDTFLRFLVYVPGVSRYPSSFHVGLWVIIIFPPMPPAFCCKKQSAWRSRRRWSSRSDLPWQNGHSILLRAAASLSSILGNRLAGAGVAQPLGAKADGSWDAVRGGFERSIRTCGLLMPLLHSLFWFGKLRTFQESVCMNQCEQAESHHSLNGKTF